MRIFFLVLISSIFAGCEDSDALQRGNVIVTYQTSFGMCSGYCINTLEISKETMVLTMQDRNRKNKDKVFMRDISQEELQEISESFEESGFLELPDQIGCPDCADGGAELIEIKTDSVTKSVLFEYGDTLQGSENFVEVLRQLFQESIEEAQD